MTRGKGTVAMGRKNKKTHIICRRCGRHTYHLGRRKCAACGFGSSSKYKRFTWQWKPCKGDGDRLK
ncbi:Ribosomal protein L37e [sediment metagenome]|uniref:Ribosomal protein L37e n=1 Tax=sediment metagenome TaxID=749907 RepID=D9PJQ3_9ZZZZ